MRRDAAALLRKLGSKAIDAGRISSGVRLYCPRAITDPRWSEPFYNLGLHDRKACGWEESPRGNQHALTLNSDYEAAWWNLGNTATARRNWLKAHRAWRSYGIELETKVGELKMPQVTVRARLNPNGNGEVVW